MSFTVHLPTVMLNCFAKNFIMKKLLIVAALIYCAEAEAKTLNVPGQYSTIQLALNAAAAGDTVTVSAGTYHENIIWPQTNNIHLLADRNANAKPVIDGGQLSRVIDIEALGGGVFTAQITGFAITNGLLNVPAHKGETGAGIFASNTVLNIFKCDISSNTITSTYDIQNNGGGAGISIVSTPAGYTNTISGCKLISNTVKHVTNGDGAAIHLDGAPAEIKNTTIKNNTTVVSEVALGNIYAYASNITVNGVTITSNTVETTQSLLAGFAAIKGGGIAVFLSNASVENTLIANNNLTPQNATLTLLGSGIYFYGEGSSLQINGATIANNKRTDGAPVSGTALFYLSSVSKTGTIGNSIFWNNDNGDEIVSLDKPVSAEYSDIRNGYNGTGDLNADPQFVSQKDFHLQNSSPCINAGSNKLATKKDIDGNRRPLPAGTNADMGCYEINQPSFASAANSNVLKVNTQVARVFPNPSNGMFTLTLPQKYLGGNMQVYNTTGELLFSEKIYSISKEYHVNWQPGIYIISVSANTGGQEKIKMLIEK